METKIPFYNLLNMFLTGLIFTGCCIILFNSQISAFIELDFFKPINEINFSLETIITVCFCAIIYEIGFIINRIGSLLGDILIKIKFIPFFDDYKKLNESKKQFPIIEILSREYAVSRTSMTLFLLLTTISCIQGKWIFIIFLLVLTVVFYISMRKHAKKIVDLLKT